MRASETKTSVNARVKREYGTCLMGGEFSGAVDAWGEYLYMKQRRDGTVTLSSLGHEILAESREYEDEEGEIASLPKEIGGKPVLDAFGEYVLGVEFVPIDDEAVITLSRGGLDEALTWLKEHGWASQKRFASCALPYIKAALKP